MNLKRAIVRALRTFAQTALGVIVASGITLGRADIITLKNALIAGIVPVITFVMNLLEDAVPAIDTRPIEGNLPPDPGDAPNA